MSGGLKVSAPDGVQVGSLPLNLLLPMDMTSCDALYCVCP